MVVAQRPRPSHNILVLIFTLAALLGAGAAAVPLQIPYAGSVSVGGQAFTGTGLFKFAIISRGCVDGGGDCLSLWSNDGSSGTGAEPDTAVSLAVDQGRFSLSLGDRDLANMTGIPVGVFRNEATFLRIWFSDGVAGYAQLSPDRQLVSVPYAYRAAEVETLKPGQAVTSINGSTDAITLQAGANVHISQQAGTVTIATTASGTGLATDVQCDGCVAMTDLDFSPISSESLAASGMTAGAAAGGDQGPGSINAEALYINGQQLKPAVPVPGYISGQNIYINDSMDPQSESLYLDNTFPIRTWQTIGPTGSGANITWSTLDSVRTDAKILILKILNSTAASPGNGLMSEVYFRKPGSTTSANINVLASAIDYAAVLRDPDTSADIIPDYLRVSSVDTVYVPTKNNSFEMWRNGGSGSTMIKLVGWIE